MIKGQLSPLEPPNLFDTLVATPSQSPLGGKIPLISAELTSHFANELGMHLIIDDVVKLKEGDGLHVAFDAKTVGNLHRFYIAQISFAACATSHTKQLVSTNKQLFILCLLLSLLPLSLSYLLRLSWLHFTMLPPLPHHTRACPLVFTWADVAIPTTLCLSIYTTMKIYTLKGIFSCVSYNVLAMACSTLGVTSESIYYRLGTILSHQGDG